MTYNVFGGTLSLTQSINHSLSGTDDIVNWLKTTVITYNTCEMLDSGILWTCLLQ